MKSVYKLKTLGVSLAVCLLLAACAIKGAQKSGFLRDYSMLTPDAKVEGALRYESSKLDLGKYNKFMIDPIIAHFAPKGRLPFL